MMEGDMEAGEIPSLLDQRIRGFKHFDPTLSLANKTPNDGQYGTFITSADISQLYNAPSQINMRVLPLSPTQPNITHPSEGIHALRHDPHSRTQRSKHHYNMPRILSKYVAPPPIDIVRITEEDAPPILASPFVEVVPRTTAKVDVLFSGSQVTQSLVSIQSIVTEMTHPLVPLLSPFPLDIFGIATNECTSVVPTEIPGHTEAPNAEEVSCKRALDDEPAVHKKRKKVDGSSNLEPSVGETLHALPSSEDSKRDGTQNNLLVVSGGGTKITLKIPRKSQPNPPPTDDSRYPTENKQNNKPMDVEKELESSSKEHKRHDKTRKDSKQNDKNTDKIMPDKHKSAKDEYGSTKTARDKFAEPSKTRAGSPTKDKVSNSVKVSRKGNSERDNTSIQKAFDHKAKDTNDHRAKTHSSENKERVRTTWPKLRTDAINIKRAADDLAKDDSTRVEALDVYLNATIKFLECCRAREQEDFKGAPDMYKQCSAFFTTCAAICEKYKDNARASIQLKSAALASSRSFQLKRERLHQQCDHMIQQLRLSLPATQNAPTPPTIPSPGLISTPPSPVSSSSDKTSLDQTKLISILEDTKEACSVFDTWTRSEVLAQLEPLPNYAIVEIQQAIDYIKRQVLSLVPKG